MGFKRLVTCPNCGYQQTYINPESMYVTFYCSSCHSKFDFKGDIDR